MKNKKVKHKSGVIFWIITGILLFTDVLLFVALDYLKTTFDVSFSQIYATLLLPMEGADASFIGEAVLNNLWKIMYFILPFALLLFIDYVILKKAADCFNVKLGKTVRRLSFKAVYRSGVLLSALALFVAALISVDSTLNIVSFLKTYKDVSTVYEEYYVDPVSVSIEPEGTPKNVIYIYVESLETAYASTDVGGKQPENNYIKNLTRIAGENTSFSNNTSLGGFRCFGTTKFTFGALVASTFGFPISASSVNVDYEKGQILPGAANFGDILESKGYNQEFLCGSDASFADRDNLYTSHGSYKIFDYYSAIDAGYIDKDYFVWWGLEDQKLYEIAKDEITALANEDKPFNFTMLTVDTHHIDGYVCELCENKYPDQLANVVACADRQINDFLSWIKEQPFYKDTVVVIVGDHPRMDTSLVEGLEMRERTVYNCIINSDKTAKLGTVNREFNSMDLFPTVLSAMGFKIEGNRLGLGTDLYSETPTLVETLGYDDYAKSLEMRSVYYEQNFN